MISLGISEDLFDSGVTLCDGERVLFASNEERYSRRKNEGGFPRLALQAALDATAAGPDEIDLALKLGLNYPQGPLEMAADLGLATTLAVMERLQAITGDDRYRPAGWLRRRALLDLPIDAPA